MLSNLSIKMRLAGIVLLVIVGVVALVGKIVAENHASIVEQRHAELESIVDTAAAITAAELVRAEAGEITVDEAKANALAALGAMRYRGKEYVFVTGMDGVMVMNPFAPQLVGKDVSDLQDADGVYLIREFQRTAKEQGSGVVNYLWPKPGSKEALPKASYVKGFTQWGWIIGTGVYVDDLQAELIASIASASVMALIGLAVIIGSMTWVSLSITRPLSRLSGTMSALAAGQTDVIVDGTDRRDEIGPMARSVDAFREGLIERARLERQTSEDAVSQKNRQSRIESLIVDFRGTSQAALTHVLANTETMSVTADKLTGRSHQAATHAEGAMEATQNAASNVQTVAAAAEELAATIGEIAGKITQTTDTVSRVTTMTADANVKVGSLAEAAQKIGDVVSLISDIAEQTNLLALNATIEAARAGEAGRGFAVVASEVKSLANQTAKATEEISAQISAVQSSTSAAVNAISDISSVMTDVDETTAAIATAVEQQRGATSEISRNAQAAADGTRNVVENTEGVTRDVESTAVSAVEVQTAAKDVESRTNELQSAVNRFLEEVAAA